MLVKGSVTNCVGNAPTLGFVWADALPLPSPCPLPPPLMLRIRWDVLMTDLYITPIEMPDIKNINMTARKIYEVLEVK